MREKLEQLKKELQILNVQKDSKSLGFDEDDLYHLLLGIIISMNDLLTGMENYHADIELCLNSLHKRIKTLESEKNKW